MEICANLPKIFFDDQVSYYKLRKKKFLVDNRIVFDKPRFLGSEVLTAVFFRCSISISVWPVSMLKSLQFKYIC